MAKKPNIEDLQLILLTSAAKTEGGALLPAPANIAPYDIHVREAVGLLVERGLADEIEVDEPEASWRADDSKLYGASINANGLETAKISGPAPEQPSMEPAERRKRAAPAAEGPPPIKAADAPAKAPGAKVAQVITLLKRKQGASLHQIVEATGWLPHSARAVLSGLRKKGHSLTRTQTDKGSVYRITKAG